MVLSEKNTMLLVIAGVLVIAGFIISGRKLF